MNRRLAVELILWSAGVVGAALAVAGCQSISASLAAVASHGETTLARIETQDTTTRRTGTSATIVASNPFRLSRQPSRFGYQSGDRGMLPPVVPNVVRPPFSVSGFVGGPPWEAIIEGLAGHENGLVVRAGDVIGDMKITRIRRDTVVVRGRDTTWNLTVRRTW